jgi:hypothetical protein
MRTLSIIVRMVLSVSLLSFVAACGGGGGGTGNAPQTYPSSYAGAKIIFVTSTTDSGNIKGWLNNVCANRSTGVEAADCICQEHAVRWGNLSGTFKAWLSGSTSTTSISARLNHSPLLYVNRRGEQIAANWTALTSGTMQCNDIMNYDESGQLAPSQFNMVWTGTTTTGGIGSPIRDCNNWTTGSWSWKAGAWVGLSTSITSNFNGCWTNWGWRPCDDPNRLYCVEQ